MSQFSSFADRHIGPDGAAIAAMLAVIGVDSLDELAVKAVPAGILDPPTAGGIAPAWTSCRPRPPKTRRWPSCGHWPPPTPSRCR
ncbi:glycine cleavage system P-family protein [Mycobacterium xenopi 3993]|nr:glycine cleavage system P-family protein [Mycobacterium xenopi 3993]